MGCRVFVHGSGAWTKDYLVSEGWINVHMGPIQHIGAEIQFPWERLQVDNMWHFRQTKMINLRPK